MQPAPVNVEAVKILLRKGANVLGDLADVQGLGPEESPEFELFWDEWWNTQQGVQDLLVEVASDQLAKHRLDREDLLYSSLKIKRLFQSNGERFQWMVQCFNVHQTRVTQSLEVVAFNKALATSSSTPPSRTSSVPVAPTPSPPPIIRQMKEVLDTDKIVRFIPKDLPPPAPQEKKRLHQWLQTLMPMFSSVTSYCQPGTKGCFERMLKHNLSQQFKARPDSKGLPVENVALSEPTTSSGLPLAASGLPHHPEQVQSEKVATPEREIELVTRKIQELIVRQQEIQGKLSWIMQQVLNILDTPHFNSDVFSLGDQEELRELAKNLWRIKHKMDQNGAEAIQLAKKTSVDKEDCREATARIQHKHELTVKSLLCQLEALVQTQDSQASVISACTEVIIFSQIFHLANVLESELQGEAFGTALVNLCALENPTLPKGIQLPSPQSIQTELSRLKKAAQSEPTLDQDPLIAMVEAYLKSKEESREKNCKRVVTQMVDPQCPPPQQVPPLSAATNPMEQLEILWKQKAQQESRVDLLTQLELLSRLPGGSEEQEERDNQQPPVRLDFATSNHLVTYIANYKKQFDLMVRYTHDAKFHTYTCSYELEQLKQRKNHLEKTVKEHVALLETALRSLKKEVVQPEEREKAEQQLLNPDAVIRRLISVLYRHILRERML